jgi:antitoxin CptB
MSGITRSSADLDPRRRRILYRAWRRGTREMDLLLGPFCDASLPDCNDEDVDALERLVDEPDHRLYAWLTGAEAVPAHHDTKLFGRLMAFHVHEAPRFR